MGQRYQLIYDGQCPLCQRSVRWLKQLDRSARIQYVDYHRIPDLHQIHPLLTLEQAQSKVHLVTASAQLYQGFAVLQRLAVAVPLLWPLAPWVWFPGAAVWGPRLYSWVARNRYKCAASQPEAKEE